jgi:hypothetical protein
MRAPPTVQPELHRHGLALDRQILKAAIGPAVSTSASPAAIGTDADRRAGSGNNPTVTSYFAMEAIVENRPIPL